MIISNKIFIVPLLYSNILYQHQYNDSKHLLAYEACLSILINYNISAITFIKPNIFWIHILYYTRRKKIIYLKKLNNFNNFDIYAVVMYFIVTLIHNFEC